LKPLPASPASAITAWDLPVRLGHWLLVAGVLWSWGTGHWRHLAWHRYSGYVLLGTLLFRVYWGFTGTAAARFRQFIHRPRTVWAYARTLVGRSTVPQAGHNPLGGWSVVLMLTLLGTQIALGLFSVDVDGDESGPLADYVSFKTGRFCAHLHHLCFNVLLAGIVLHLVAIGFYQFYKGQNLLRPMIGSRAAVATPWIQAVLGVLAAAAVTWLVASGLRF
jgi:cytochrome b